MDLNKVMIIGNVTNDPELRTTPSGINVCNFSVATNYVYTNQQTGQKVEQVEFHNVVLWRKLGEIAKQYLTKGKKVFIEGRLQTRSWDGEDGKKRYKTEIIGDNMIMLSPAGGQTSNYPTKTPVINSKPEKTPTAPPLEELPTIQQEDLGSVDVEGIPF
jgi:single-strand DNA-binding protein